ncbi:MAG: c-type cytochrome [Bacteroidetes bacterium]|nr:c-type cytochrome [Bacteroidota bacterium]
MKSNLSKVFASVAIFAVALSLVSFISFNKGWDVPAADKAVKNPVKADAPSIGEGKNMYMKTCKMCHGEKGTGVGKMAGTSNFTSKEFKALTDGAIYYMINTGQGKMPAYKSKIKADNDRWNLVNYLRTL